MTRDLATLAVVALCIAAFCGTRNSAPHCDGTEHGPRVAGVLAWGCP